MAGGAGTLDDPQGTTPLATTLGTSDPKCADSGGFRSGDTDSGVFRGDCTADSPPRELGTGQRASSTSLACRAHPPNWSSPHHNGDPRAPEPVKSGIRARPGSCTQHSASVDQRQREWEPYADAGAMTGDWGLGPGAKGVSKALLLSSRGSSWYFAGTLLRGVSLLFELLLPEDCPLASAARVVKLQESLCGKVSGIWGMDRG